MRQRRTRKGQAVKILKTLEEKLDIKVSWKEQK